MNRRDCPQSVRDKLAKYSTAVEHYSERLARSKDAIANARARLTGKFENDQEYNDTYATLKKLVADEPIIQRKFEVVRNTCEKLESWIESLPADTILEEVPVDVGDLTLDVVRERLAKCEEELATLKAVPTLSNGIAFAAENYVKKLARPKVTGISQGETLKVAWPDDVPAMLALLFPAKMVEVIVEEAKRIASTPLPLAERKQRIAQLEREVEKRQRQAHALGGDLYALPAAVILGVKATRRESAKAKVERQSTAA